MKNNKVEICVADVTGSALDWLVAQAEGENVVVENGLLGAWDYHYGDDHPVAEFVAYRPSEDWEQCGYLIAKHAIGFFGHDADNWRAVSAPEEVEYSGVGSTHLIAACRLIAAAHFGPTALVPVEVQP